MKQNWFQGMLWFGVAKAEEMENRRQVEDIIDFLEIEEWRNHPVALLPYGIQKLVELGRALAMDPELLLLDEPVAGMNLEETEDMARFILDIRRELGISMVMVEHDMGARHGYRRPHHGARLRREDQAKAHPKRSRKIRT